MLINVCYNSASIHNTGGKVRHQNITKKVFYSVSPTQQVSCMLQNIPTRIFIQVFWWKILVVLAHWWEQVSPRASAAVLATRNTASSLPDRHVRHNVIKRRKINHSHSITAVVVLLYLEPCKLLSRCSRILILLTAVLLLLCVSVLSSHRRVFRTALFYSWKGQ